MTAHGHHRNRHSSNKNQAHTIICLSLLKFPEFIELVEKALKSSRLMTEPVELGGNRGRPGGFGRQ